MSDVFEFVPKHGQTSRIADFAEAQCLKRDDLSVSMEDISNDLERASLNDDDAQEDHLGDAAITPEVEAAFDDLEERPLHCGDDDFYPFRLFGDGGQIAARNDCGERWHSLLYLFLLWLTLTKQKALDARALFERLCCEVARNYLGGDPAGKVSAIHFGKKRKFCGKNRAIRRTTGRRRRLSAGSPFRRCKAARRRRRHYRPSPLRRQKSGATDWLRSMQNRAFI